MANSATAISGVRRARLARGLTQDELARRAGLSRQALGAIEAAVYQPGVGAALALARELGASVEALFGRAEGAPELLEADWAPADAPAGASADGSWRSRNLPPRCALARPAVCSSTPRAGAPVWRRCFHRLKSIQRCWWPDATPP